VSRLIALVFAALLGLYLKRFYRGPAEHWVHDSVGGVFYEIFWCLVLAILLPRLKKEKVAIVVLIATCILEFLQLWHPPSLEYLRSFFIGRTILGSYFDWWDFPYYFIGTALGYALLRALDRRNP